MPADTAAKDSAVGEEAASLARRDDDANATAKKKIDHTHQPTAADIRVQMSPCLADEPLFRTSLTGMSVLEQTGQENPVRSKQ